MISNLLKKVKIPSQGSLAALTGSKLNLTASKNTVKSKKFQKPKIQKRAF